MGRPGTCLVNLIRGLCCAYDMPVSLLVESGSLYAYYYLCEMYAHLRHGFHSSGFRLVAKPLRGFRLLLVRNQTLMRVSSSRGLSVMVD